MVTDIYHQPMVAICGQQYFHMQGNRITSAYYTGLNESWMALNSLVYQVAVG
jgi:hypothetical protein